MFAAVRLRALTDSLGADDPQYRQESRSPPRSGAAGCATTPSSPRCVDDRPVGLIGAQQENAETVYLYSLWLDPAARGTGLARPLVAAAVDWARDRRARTVTLRVAADNVVGARRLREPRLHRGDGRECQRRDEVAMSLSVS